MPNSIRLLANLVLDGCRCRANSAYIKESRPDSGLGFQGSNLKTFQVVPFSLRSGAPTTEPPRGPDAPGRRPHPHGRFRGLCWYKFAGRRGETGGVARQHPPPRESCPGRLPVSSQPGTYTRVKAKLWPWPLGGKAFQAVPSSLGSRVRVTDQKITTQMLYNY